MSMRSPTRSQVLPCSPPVVVESPPLEVESLVVLVELVEGSMVVLEVSAASVVLEVPPVDVPSLVGTTVVEPVSATAVVLVESFGSPDEVPSVSAGRGSVVQPSIDIGDAIKSDKRPSRREGMAISAGSVGVLG